MLRRRAGLWAGALGCALTLGLETAHAGPVEQLNGISIDRTNAKNLIVPFAFGGNGLFVSQDGGTTLEWLCAAAVTRSANSSNSIAFSVNNGRIHVGLFEGLMRGDADGCKFQWVPELDKNYIRAIASDPIDAKRTYVVTSNATADNGLHLDDGGGTFAPYGKALPGFIESLIVAKRGEGRRFYLTAAINDAMTNQVKYSVRVSDDEGMTWTDEVVDLQAIDPGVTESTEISVIAVDPDNPDHVFGNLWRRRGADTLIMSTQKGQAGSWKIIAKPTEFGGIAFTPDGKLYFGDSDSNTRGLYVIEAAGAEPKPLNSCLRISCLGYDEANQRLLGCGNNFLFGTIDRANGKLKPLLDLRCAEHALACADKPEIQQLCQPPGVEYCKLDHWLLAPLCTVYDRGTEFCTYARAQEYHCVDGFAAANDPADAAGNECSTALNTGVASDEPSLVEQMCGSPNAGSSAPSPAGTSAAAGSGAAGSGGAGQSGAGAAGSSSAPPMSASKSGCSCSSVGSQSSGSSAWLAWLAVMVGLVRLRRPREKA